MGEIKRPVGELMPGAVAEGALWGRPAFHPMLEEAEVHVWRVALGASTASLPSLAMTLSDQERTQAWGYTSWRDRRRFMTVRGVLRRLLADYLGLEPQAIVLTRGPHGKPEMAAAGRVPALSFNVAHAGGIGLIAIAGDRAVGIDVETVRADFDWGPIARRFFSHEEYAFLISMPADERLRAFMVLWTRKEACLKAAGLGVARGLEEVEVSVDPRRRATLVHAPREMLPVSRWDLRDLVPADGYQACLVTEGKDVCVRQLVWCDRREASEIDSGLDGQAQAPLSRMIEQASGQPPS